MQAAADVDNKKANSAQMNMTGNGIGSHAGTGNIWCIKLLCHEKILAHKSSERCEGVGQNSSRFHGDKM